MHLVQTLALALALALTSPSPSCACSPAHHSAIDPVTAPQSYHPDDHAALQSARRMAGTTAPQAYGGGYGPTACGSVAYPTTWVPLTPANARPIRITVVWDLIANGDTGVCDDGTLGPCTYQCTSAGQAGVKVRSADGVIYTSAGFNCSGSDSVGALKPDNPSNYYSPAMNVNAKIMYDRTMAAVNFWASTLQVVPVLDSIVIPTGAYVAGGLSTSALGVLNHVCPSGASASCALTYSNTDLVMIMTARPSPNSPTAGYALCLQSDQWGRCTVGQFNWVPGGLDRSGYALGSESSKESELRTALHQLVHVFGGMGPGIYQPLSNFIDNTNGCRQPTASVILVKDDDPAFLYGSKKPVTYIVSPKVANLTKYYYNCPTAVGFPLEDVPLGKGVHWEARVAGPELMSLGVGSGQAYLSDLTLAFLEDTGHFLANYSRAGLLLPPTHVSSAAALDESQGAPLPGAQQSPLPPRLPPGAPRYGYLAGCAWLGQPPPAAPAPTLPLAQAMPAPYSCAAAGQQLCTVDARQSAVCIVQASFTNVSDTPSVGGYNQVQFRTTGMPVYGAYGFATPGAARGFLNTLPPWAQWFTDAGAVAATGGAPGATAATTGGYSDAADYMPLPLGFWSCSMAEPYGNASGAGGGSAQAAVASEQAAASVARFGGQLRCPACRCLVSSLSPAGAPPPPAGAFGLCYRANCVTRSLLQVAAAAAGGGLQWVTCPPAGGTMAVAGFSGALTCPPAASFCAREEPSGVLYGSSASPSVSPSASPDASPSASPIVSPSGHSSGAATHTSVAGAQWGSASTNASTSASASASARDSTTPSGSPTPMPTATFSAGASPSATSSSTLTTSPMSTPSPSMSQGASPSGLTVSASPSGLTVSASPSGLTVSASPSDTPVSTSPTLLPAPLPVHGASIINGTTVSTGAGPTPSPTPSQSQGAISSTSTNSPQPPLAAAGSFTVAGLPASAFISAAATNRTLTVLSDALASAVTASSGCRGCRVRITAVTQLSTGALLYSTAVAAATVAAALLGPQGAATGEVSTIAVAYAVSGGSAAALAGVTAEALSAAFSAALLSAVAAAYPSATVTVATSAPPGSAANGGSAIVSSTATTPNLGMGLMGVGLGVPLVIAALACAWRARAAAAAAAAKAKTPLRSKPASSAEGGGSNVPLGLGAPPASAWGEKGGGGGGDGDGSSNGSSSSSSGDALHLVDNPMARATKAPQPEPPQPEPEPLPPPVLLLPLRQKGVREVRLAARYLLERDDCLPPGWRALQDPHGCGQHVFCGPSGIRHKADPRDNTEFYVLQVLQAWRAGSCGGVLARVPEDLGARAAEAAERMLQAHALPPRWAHVRGELVAPCGARGLPDPRDSVSAMEEEVAAMLGAQSLLCPQSASAQPAQM